MDPFLKKIESAIPAMEMVECAVDCLSVKTIIDFGSFAIPPPGTELVMRAIQILKGVTNRKQLIDWGAQQKMLMYTPSYFI